MKLEISREDDRLTVATVLVKNGYIVSQRRCKKATGKSYTYYLEVDKHADLVEINEHKEE